MPSSGLAFGFRRLAIIDLSEHGHQPMRSRSGRFQVVFNGEIFNFAELASELSECGHTFRGHSDTEVALAAFEQWGIANAVTRFIGMFAMAIWDTERESLTLLRDRLGLKPLFVYENDGVVAFASELKALSAAPGFRKEIDVEALAQYFRHLYVPAPRSIFRNVRKLLPGHLLEIQSPTEKLPESKAYWSLQDKALSGRVNPFAGGDEEAVDALDAALVDAVRIRMRADVPVGAFLSGGVDSSLVVALMQEVSETPVRTFTVGFDSGAHDESSEAAQIAQHLGTAHHRLHLGATDALDIIPDLPEIYDEPLGNPSQLPTYLICRAARQQVTVALSGDGGDELFAGYNRYSYGSRIISRVSRFPKAPRQLVAAGLTSISTTGWDSLQGAASSLLRFPPQRLAGEKAHKLGHLLRAPDAAGMYRSLVSAWQSPPVRSSSGHDPRTDEVLGHPSLSMLESWMLADQLGYLADNSLTKVDRASMAVGLELRAPILDHRVVELSWRLSEDQKLRNGQGKWALRQVLHRRVPRELIDRPKVGLSVPLAEWLRGPLRSWADDCLDPAKLAEVPALEPGRIRTVWKQFLSGSSNDYLALWTVLMFQAWRERWSV